MNKYVTPSFPLPDFTSESDAFTYTPGFLFPDDSDLRLTRAEHVEQYKQSNNDYQQWLSFMWLFLGAIGGIITNWITSDPIIITLPSIYILIVLSILTIYFGITARKYKNRSDDIHDRIMQSGITLYDLRDSQSD